MLIEIIKELMKDIKRNKARSENISTGAHGN